MAERIGVPIAARKAARCAAPRCVFVALCEFIYCRRVVARNRAGCRALGRGERERSGKHAAMGEVLKVTVLLDKL